MTEQPSTKEISKPLELSKPPDQILRLDFEYDDELLKCTNRLLDEAKQVRVHPIQYELSVVKSQLKQLAFVTESQLEMMSKSFRIDFEYLEKRWRREYRHGYAFMSELTAKEEREYTSVEAVVQRCEQRVERLEQALGE